MEDDMDTDNRVKIKVENEVNIKLENEAKIKVEDEVNIKVENEVKIKVEEDCQATSSQDAESDDFSEIDTPSDNDSDYVPEPVKKKMKTSPSKRGRAAKTKTNSAENLENIKKEDGEDIMPTGRKRKAPTKRANTASKKIKTENESTGETLEVKEKVKKPRAKQAPKAPKLPKTPKLPKAPKATVKRKRGVKTETQASTEPATESTDPCHTGDIQNNADITPGEVSSCDIAQIVANAKKFYEPWKDEEVVAETTNIPLAIAKNVIDLLDQDCTIPFIVRYRKEMTGGLLAEKLRDIQSAYDEAKLVHKKVENILKSVRSKKFDETAARALLSAKTLEEVEFLYAPFKPGSKKTLAERSKQLGLEPLALQLLESKITLPNIDFSLYIKPLKGLETRQEILTGIQHIIADAISKDRKVLDFVRSLSNHHSIKIASSKSASAEKEDRKANVEGKTTENFKYENYFNLNILLKYIAHHQVMAVNRGEKQKVLTVKVQIPFEVKRRITDFIWYEYFKKIFLDRETLKYLQDCVQDAYDRLIEPHIIRQIRSDLTKKAEKESIAIFCSNVRSLLLTPPVRGKTVIGVDPGFSHGCKLAALSCKGEVLETDVIYPHTKSKAKGDISDGVKLKALISKYGAEIIAIGNGTACRETEMWLSNLITSKFFRPYEIKYCIVNESGVSIYSVTKEAEAELPNMDTNVRSAVAIGRRLQDPLLEYVKIEPKHLGVGMYQHDVPEAQLKKALDSVVEECVSFVGVDLNVCPEFMLRKISGLSAAKAKQIVEWRAQNGSFINRQQLLGVKGLGPKSFEQCAGFVKILPETSSSTETTSMSSDGKGKKKGKSNVSHNPNPLDRTIIHPESYETAEKFLKELNANPNDIGMQMFVDKVNSYMRFKSVEDLAKSLNVAVPVIQLIVDAFKQLLDYDIRGEFDQPLFMTSVRKFSDLQAGQELTGRVMNVAGFGAFVDIGVERNGLIHNSKMKGQTVNVGDRVTVKVLNVEFDKKRIQLELLRK